MSETPAGSEMERNIDKLGIKLTKDIVNKIKDKLKDALRRDPTKTN